MTLDGITLDSSVDNVTGYRVNERGAVTGSSLQRHVPMPSHKFVLSVQQFKHKSRNGYNKPCQNSVWYDISMIRHADGRKEQGGVLMSHLP